MKHSTANIIREDKANENNLAPIWTRITVDGISRYIASGYFVPPTLWTEGSQEVKKDHLQAHIINSDITALKTAIMNRMVELKRLNQIFTADSIKKEFSSKTDLHNIFDFISEYKKNITGKRADGTVGNYEKFERKLELFHGSRALSFEEIDTSFLQRFENHLRKEGLDGNYIWGLWGLLMKFFNAAKELEIITHYPFKNYENPAFSQKDKDHLALDEIDKLEAYIDWATDPKRKEAAIYFLFACYSGLRISDWYRFDLKNNVYKNTIRLRAKKNGEWVTMPITGRLRRILERMKETPLTIDPKRVYDILTAITTEESIKITKHVTPHTGRHTFAVTLCAEQGIGLEVCAELMGITIDTCYKSYYRVTKTKIAKECITAWEGL